MNRSDVAEAGFAELARGFCAWCEGESLGDSPEATAGQWIARLHAAALALPDVGADNADGLPDLPEREAVRAAANIARFAGCHYREFFDPDPSLQNEAVMGDIGDDLLDIYEDVKAGLVLTDQGRGADALWHWSFLHRIHWGRHAVGAMFALHCMTANKST
ncbi:DUF5063 domain-containing protein [Roseateles sp. NT4]|uniref:DUF5063 domain-containing protein n=1 Tax=Roseateles sp. NT4 TaxID=3453715 RepID=UPI003EED35B6